MELLHTAFEPAGDGPHPTIVALHGWGASALDLLGLAPHLDDGRFLVLCPQGPTRVPIGPGAQGYGWFPLSLGGPPNPDAVEAATLALSSFLVHALHRYPVAPDRLALLGFSQGGVMAYRLALHRPAPFSALAALSSWIPPELAGPAGEPPNLQRLPVLVQHGVRDELVSVERGRAAVDLLRRWNANPVYREYDMGHEISAASLRDLVEFLHDRLVSPIVAP